MPSISEAQWQAMRKTAAAVARDVAEERFQGVGAAVNSMVDARVEFHAAGRRNRLDIAERHIEQLEDRVALLEKTDSESRADSVIAGLIKAGHRVIFSTVTPSKSSSFWWDGSAIYHYGNLGGWELFWASEPKREIYPHACKWLFTMPSKINPPPAPKPEPRWKVIPGHMQGAWVLDSTKALHGGYFYGSVPVAVAVCDALNRQEDKAVQNR